MSRKNIFNYVTEGLPPVPLVSPQPQCTHTDGCARPRTHRPVASLYRDGVSLRFSSWTIEAAPLPQYAGYAGALYCDAHAQMVADAYNAQDARAQALRQEATHGA